MNKLIIDNSIKEEIIVIDSDMDLEVNLQSDRDRTIRIQVVKGVFLNVLDVSNRTKNHIIYDIADSSCVVVNKLSIDCEDQVDVYLGEEASLEFHTSLINYHDNIYRQKVYHQKKNSKSKLVNHCINVENVIFQFVVDGIITKEAKNTTFRQDNKIINLKEGKSSILPNLIVDHNDIEASHSAYIGTFEEEKLFYMESRGISKEESYALLIIAFLVNDMDLEEDKREIFHSIIENQPLGN